MEQKEGKDKGEEKKTKEKMCQGREKGTRGK
jgi:hypothetical protein